MEIVMMNALITTATVSCSALFVVLLIGVPLAFFVTRCSPAVKRWADALLTVPMVLPPTVIGFSLVWFLGRNGFLGRYLYQWFDLSLLFSWWGAVLAAAVVSFPLLYRSARGAFSGIDDHLEDAARSLGQSEISVFFRVSLPLAKRGVVVGTLLGLARAMGEFGATLMVAGNLPGKTQTLSLAIYESVQSGSELTAIALCACALAFGLVILLSTERLERGGLV
jgi:molybdate transport system permease protein